MEERDIMTDEDYLATQNQIILLTGFVIMMDLDGFLDRIEVAHAAGPMVDPTVYRKALHDGTMEIVDGLQRLAEKLKEFKDLSETLDFLKGGMPG